MTTRMITAAAFTALTLGAAAHAQSEDVAMSQGFNMLTGAVYNALSHQGFDTTNINELTLAEIATIRTLLNDEMGTNARQRVQAILDRADG